MVRVLYCIIEIVIITHRTVIHARIVRDVTLDSDSASDDARATARANVIFRDVRLETLKIRERVREGIARLRSRGIGVGIITNGHEIV